VTRISFFVHDLAANPIVRAAALASAMSRDYEVELLGFLHSGELVYAPYRDRFIYKTLSVPLDTLDVVRAIPKLAEMATGSIVYACKPLVTSLGPALWRARIAGRAPLFLDVEDDEWVAPHDGPADFAWRHVVKGWRHATAWKYTRAIHPLVRCADGVSVSTRRLQRRYGGTIVRHGPDGDRFNPEARELTNAAACRARWRLPEGAPLVLFAGVPQPHKGWHVLLDALQRPDAQAWHLVLAGARDHHDFAEAQRLLGRRCHSLGLIANDDMPSLLAAVDAVAVPQLDTPFARTQLPAKILEAMAMARAVVATTIGDLPEILGGGARGFLVPPDDGQALASAFHHIAADPAASRARGRAARAWFLEEASVAEMRRRLTRVFVESRVIGRSERRHAAA